MRIGYVRVFLLFVVAGAIVGLVSVDGVAQSATLFSRNKYPTNQLKDCITFVESKGPEKQRAGGPIELQTPGRPIELGRQSELTNRPCDVSYGGLWVSGALDWFQSSGAQGNRSVIKDLGPYTWTDKFIVPVVAALPKLKPGEVRTVTINTDGADAPGVKNRRDGKPKVDRMFVKAVVGHIYVIHVVDDDYDFYALFRVDQLMRGDSCVVSWKLVDAPSEEIR